jgi:hypothetical protein
MRKNEVYVPWQQRLFISIPESAAILSRSTERVRTWVAEGRLDGRRLTPGGPLAVTVASLLRFADELEVTPADMISQPTTWPPLRLVVNNDTST